MKIKRLNLIAFGPFTDTSLDFSGSDPDLHIVYGPNEAGKSSTLRALTAWLFGIPERTRDNFLHPNEQLCISGVLQNGQDRELGFSRRKKRKASILDADGNPMDPDHIRDWLQGLDQQAFASLFGLDHTGLVQGGDTILQEKGSAGTTLFSAGTGIAHLQEILNNLTAESEEIFKPQGSKPALNTAIREFAQLKKETNRLIVSSQEWMTQERELRRAENELQDKKERRRRLQRDLQHRKRVQQALRPLGRLREAESKLDKLGPVPALPGDFPQRRQASQEQLGQARQTLSGATQRLHAFQAKAEGIEVNAELLDQAATIHDLHQRLGSYRQGLRERPELEEQHRQHLAQAQAILRRIRPDLNPDQAGELSPLLKKRREINTLGGKWQLLAKEGQNSAQRVEALQREAEAAGKKLAELPLVQEVTGLDQTIAAALKLGDVDADLDKKARALTEQQAGFTAELSRLGLWQGGPRELLHLSLPLQASVRRFVRAWQELESKGWELQTRDHTLRQEEQRLNRDILAQEKVGDVPTEQELTLKRQWREQGWHLLRRKWLQGQDISAQAREYAPEEPLDQAYERAVAQADKTADRLRRESQRVHEYARLQADLEQVRQQWRQMEQEKAQLDRDWTDLQAKWEQAWEQSGIQPLSPEEMAAWLEGIHNLRLKAEHIGQAEQTRAALEEQRRQVRSDLEKALIQLGETPPSGQSLAPILEMAQVVRDRSRTTARKRQELQDKLDRTQTELAEAREEAQAADRALGTWKRQWAEYMREIGLPESETPETVADFFDSLEACLGHVDKARDFSQRIERIDLETQNLRAEVSTLIQRVAPELNQLPVDQAVESLNGLLARAGENEATWKTYQEGIRTAEEEIRQAELELKEAERELLALCRLAGCSQAEELEEIEQRWRQAKTLETAMHQEEEILRDIAQPYAVSDLIQEVDLETEPDTLPQRIQEQEEELDKLDRDIEEQVQVVSDLNTAFRAIDGRDEAARKWEEAGEKLTAIRRLAAGYTRLRLAAKVLGQEIERYRAENQDPVLSLAAGYFAELTLNSFDGLRTDLDDRGGQVIVGLRNGGSRVPVEGMSDGTRDQLYLALRLASLEHRLQNHQPMPFVVDDILINFDEQRSRAALQALARLGHKNQVLVFSHHKQLFDIVQELGVGQVHKLTSSPSWLQS